MQMNKSYTLSPVSLLRHPVLDLQENPWPRACFSNESYYKTEKFLHGRKCELWKSLEDRGRQKEARQPLSFCAAIPGYLRASDLILSVRQKQVLTKTALHSPHISYTRKVIT